MSRMKRKILLSIMVLAGSTALASLAMAPNAQAAFLYKLTVTTAYAEGSPFSGTDLGSGFFPSPDTSFVDFMNNGPTTFVGTLADTAVSAFSGDFSKSFSGITLAPGQDAWFATSPESSNVGGFNGPFGTPQPGIELSIVGTFGATAVNLSVNDADIHSGVPRLNPFGNTVDSYVLQGGDPLGQDTGDAFEETQAQGTFVFAQPSPVPVPAALPLFATAIGGLAAFRRWRKHQMMPV
jgi:hypothetical protein